MDVRSTCWKTITISKCFYFFFLTLFQSCGSSVMSFHVRHTWAERQSPRIPTSLNICHNYNIIILLLFDILPQHRHRSHYIIKAKAMNHMTWGVKFVCSVSFSNIITCMDGSHTYSHLNADFPRKERDGILTLRIEPFSFLATIFSMLSMSKEESSLLGLTSCCQPGSKKEFYLVLMEHSSEFAHTFDKTTLFHGRIDVRVVKEPRLLFSSLS